MRKRRTRSQYQRRNEDDLQEFVLDQADAPGKLRVRYGKKVSHVLRHLRRVSSSRRDAGCGIVGVEAFISPRDLQRATRTSDIGQV